MIALAAFALAQAALPAPGWERVASTDAGSVWYVHRPSISRHAQYVQIWIRVDHSNDRTMDRDVETSRSLVMIECASRRYHLETTSAFGADGSELGEPAGRSPSESIAPDTVMEAVWRVACSR